MATHGGDDVFTFGEDSFAFGDIRLSMGHGFDTLLIAGWLSPEADVRMSGVESSVG